MIPLPDEVKTRLRQHALAALVAALRGRTRPAPPQGGEEEHLTARRALFVSVYVGDELRGCAGSLEERGPLLAEVGRWAAEAARADPRYRGILPADFAALRVEISVLGACTSVEGPGEVVPGRHGVVVRLGARTGVLLPQVGLRQGWDAGTLVRQAAIRGAIGVEELEGASISIFEAEVF
ncbi:MAG: AmmeMemoRadiSam system protein A [Planctomycetaceae bacterium]